MGKPVADRGPGKYGGYAHADQYNGTISTPNAAPTPGTGPIEGNEQANPRGARRPADPDRARSVACYRGPKLGCGDIVLIRCCVLR